MVANNKLSVKLIIFSLEESSDLDSSAAGYRLELHNRLENDKQQLTLARVKEHLRELLANLPPE